MDPSGRFLGQPLGSFWKLHLWMMRVDCWFLSVSGAQAATSCPVSLAARGQVPGDPGLLLLLLLAPHTPDPAWLGTGDTQSVLPDAFLGSTICRSRNWPLHVSLHMHVFHVICQCEISSFPACSPHKPMFIHYPRICFLSSISEEPKTKS